MHTYKIVVRAYKNRNSILHTRIIKDCIERIKNDYADYFCGAVIEIYRQDRYNYLVSRYEAGSWFDINDND